MPLVVGEFGAFKRAFGTVDSAASWIDRLITEFEPDGFNGWLYWTYDTHEQGEQMWHARSGNSAIYDRLIEAAR